MGYFLFPFFCSFAGAFGNESYLDCPEGMTLGPNGMLYVASFLDDKVVRFSIPRGDFLGVVSRLWLCYAPCTSKEYHINFIDTQRRKSQNLLKDNLHFLLLKGVVS